MGHAKCSWGLLAIVALNAAGCTETGGKPSSETAKATLQVKGRDTVWVVMKQQADLRPALAIKDWKARGQFVYSQLTGMSTSTQNSVRARLASKGLAYKSFWIVNSIKVEADQATIDELAKDPNVARIEPDQTYALPPIKKEPEGARVQAIEWGLTNIRAPEAWAAFDARGQGIVIANIDTGVQFDHPALIRQYRGNLGSGSFDHNYSWHDPSRICGNPSLVPCDNHAHGTHTMGTMVGDDGNPGANQIGVAPMAKWIAAKGCEGTSGCSREALLSSGQWIVAPTDLAGLNPRPDMRPHIVNNSWGSSADDVWYQQTVQAWVTAGIFPAFSNGNSGPGCSTAGSPGEYPEAYAVGAYDVNNVIASFSSRGASFLGAGIKPNIAAPGVNVRSSVPGGAYDFFSGTSMAAPHLAGVVAMIWSAAPSLQGDIAGTRTLLDTTARDVSDLSCGGTAAFNNVWGEGRVDAFAAVDQAPRGPTGTLAGSVTSLTGAAIAGATVRADGPSVRSAVSDALGSFSFTAPAGTYRVTGSAFGFASATATGVEVTQGATTTVALVLTAAPSFAVSGTVSDAGGAPVNGARVTIVGTPIPPATTGADGRYSFASVPAGQYDVRAEADGRCRAPQMQPLTIEGDETLDFLLPRRTDAAGYYCESASFAFVDAPTVLALSGDDSSVQVTLPFPFRFYGVSYGSAFVTTNGLVNFLNLSSTYSNVGIPSTGDPNAAIFALWDDLVVDGSTGTVRTGLVGTAPNRQFVIEWRDVAFLGTSLRTRFEIILHENSQVTVQYHTAGPDPRQQGSSATAGIENASGTIGLQYSNGEAALQSGTAIRYARQVPNDMQPPSATLTAPASGATIGGNVTVSATATDNTGVASVEFYLDRGTPGELFLGTDATAPYQITFNTAPIANGAHTLTARAIDLGELGADSPASPVTVFNDLVPPIVQITAPADGSTVSGTVNVAVTATDDFAVTRVDFLLGGSLLGSDTTAPYALAWNTGSLASGSHILTARAIDNANNIGTSAPVRVSINNAQGATYDATLRAPRCSFIGFACDSEGLLNGRAGLGPEPSQPNTINNSCADGPVGIYHSDESLDRLRIETQDGTPLAAGKVVTVRATVWAYSSANVLDLYHAPNASSPTWTLIGSFNASGAGQQTITASLTLPSGNLQAIRGNFRYGGTQGTCSPGSFNDRDDLVFTISSPDPIPPTASITSPAPDSLVRGTVTVTATATGNVGVTQVDLLVDGSVVATDTAAPYSFTWNTTAIVSGSHQLQARARDAAGNAGTSAAVRVTVDNTVPSVMITAPATGATVSGTVMVAASASDETTTIDFVQFLVDSVVLAAGSTAPYVWSWDTSTVTAGSHILTARATDVAGNQTTSAPVTVTVNAPAFQYIWREAESGDPTTPFVNSADATASGGRYIAVATGNNSGTAPPAGGRATFAFTVPTAGTYKVWARVIAPSTSDDSFWVMMDVEPPVNWNNIPNTTTTGWQWDDVHNGAQTGNPAMQFGLTAGAHSLVIAYREDGAKLDRVLITNDLSFVPMGLGPLVPPAAPTNVTAAGGNTQVTVTWTASAGAASYSVRRGASGGPYAPLASGIPGTSHSDTELANGTQQCYVVTAVNAAGESGDSTQACATPGVPTWASNDVGAVGVPGNYSQSGGTYTVRGSGVDIWGASDEFHFVNQAVTGNMTITARVASVGNTNGWAKAGVMIRNGLGETAFNVFTFLTPTAVNGFRFQSRTVAGSSNSALGAAGTTGWVRLVRSGNTFTGFFSPNGTQWTPVGAPTTIPSMPATAIVGLAVTSHNDGVLTTAVFDNVTITP